MNFRRNGSLKNILQHFAARLATARSCGMEQLKGTCLTGEKHQMHCGSGSDSWAQTCDSNQILLAFRCL